MPAAAKEQWALKTQPINRPPRRFGEFIDSIPVGNVHHYVVPAKVAGPFALAAQVNNEGVPTSWKPLSPNLDIVTSSMYGGVKELAVRLRASKILHDNNQVGNLAAVIEEACKEAEFTQEHLQAGNDQDKKDALQLKKYIETIQSFVGKEVEDVFWMGMPKHPIQFIAILQQKIADISEDFDMPPFNDDYVFLAEVEKLGIGITRACSSFGTASQQDKMTSNDILDLMRTCSMLEGRSPTMPPYNWSQWCAVAGHPHLSQMIAPLRRDINAFITADNRDPTPTERPQHPLVVRAPAEQAPKISRENLDILESYVVRNAINEIRVEQVGILIDAAGPIVEQVQGGVEDVYKFYISTLFLKEIERIKDLKYTEFGLRLVPTAMLLKLVTIRFDKNDIFSLQYFGHLLYRDRREQNKTMNVNYADKSISVMAPQMHAWSEIIVMDDLATVMRGLADAANMLLHPSILSAEEIIALLNKFHEVYDSKAGLASTKRMKGVLRQRLSERATALRQIANGQTSVKEPLHILRGASLDLFNILVSDADASIQVMRVTREMGGGTGETRIGKKRTVARGYGPLEKSIDYFRPKKPGKGDTIIDPTDRETDEVKPVPICAKCTLSGHKMAQCRKGWGPLSKLPAHLKSLGKRKRDEAKVDHETGKPVKKQA